MLGHLSGQSPSSFQIESGPGDPGPVKERSFSKAGRLRRTNSIVHKADAINLSVDFGAPTLSPTARVYPGRLVGPRLLMLQGPWLPAALSCTHFPSLASRMKQAKKQTPGESTYLWRQE